MSDNFKYKNVVKGRYSGEAVYPFSELEEAINRTNKPLAIRSVNFLDSFEHRFGPNSTRDKDFFDEMLKGWIEYNNFHLISRPFQFFNPMEEYVFANENAYRIQTLTENLNETQHKFVDLFASFVSYKHFVQVYCELAGFALLYIPIILYLFYAFFKLI